MRIRIRMKRIGIGDHYRNFSMKRNALRFWYDHADNETYLPGTFEIWNKTLQIWVKKNPNEMCRRCGRDLKANDSIINGMGKECWKQEGIITEFKEIREKMERLDSFF